MYVWSRPLSTPPLNSAWPISPSKAAMLRLARRPASAYYQKTTVAVSWLSSDTTRGTKPDFRKNDTVINKNRGSTANRAL